MEKLNEDVFNQERFPDRIKIKVQTRSQCFKRKSDSK